MLFIHGHSRCLVTSFIRSFDLELLNGFINPQWRNCWIFEILAGSHSDDRRCQAPPPVYGYNSRNDGVKGWLTSILYRRITQPSVVTAFDPSGIRQLIDKLTYLFNRLRTDKKHRKRAFPKRGYWRRTHAMLRKDNKIKYAYALEGIDYEMIEKLDVGEIPDIKTLRR